ncbi:asparagine synthase (glutamine-hydrolyzing) [Pontibacter anaerobius]|uniref:asparagine synthase (glutamine-hydrolyzing) n=1 Tax=Pontibacter anaerobius TaxID=2993940 RepID=A0ABT3RJ75_9BACT|nr:asparagine synthase (glutamine-hydrolyzing) [Pontibacter anaerobius]MCX2741556.1 asparagine synthase (glutamine-hydrolyzing) [Pontibacter anaerobius]
MCGIGGAINFKRSEISLETIKSIGNSIEHRGPDDHGFYFADGGEKVLTRDIKDGFDFNVALLHRRLSILDLSERGWQPMQTSDKRYTITYNGEVYNYIELRELLISEGYQFQTETDTEVILYAYQAWGEKCLERFNGMFAFAIHDAVKNEVFLARDPFGIKPLYYSINSNFLLFCSEIKGIVVEPKVSKKINGARLQEYLAYGWTNHSSETIYEDVHEFPAAHYAIVSASKSDRLQPKPYWTLDNIETSTISFKEAASRVEEIFYNNIKIHLRSDVEVGYTLSGGLDSSSVICIADKILPKHQKHAFSYIPNYEEKSEKKWIDIVNAKVGSTPYFTQPSEATFISEIEKIIALQDEPFGGTSIYAQYKVFELVKENNIKVVLDGQGADEIFAGYIHYFSDRAMSILQKDGLYAYIAFIRKIDPLLNVPKLKLVLKGVAKFLPWDMQKHLNKRYLSHTERFFKGEVLNTKYKNITGPDFGDNYLKASLYNRLKHVGLPWLLRYQDRNSMAFSIEGRVPFLTKDLVEFVFSLPESYILTNDGYTKKLMREGLKSYLPKEVLERKDKIGFETPEQKWIKSSSTWALEILNSGNTKNYGINMNALKSEFKEVFSNKAGYTEEHWRYLNFFKWAEINKATL